jgi:hypothetical protein
MPEIPEAAVQAVAEQMLRRYDSQYSAAHLTWRDFADDARADLEAAAPSLAVAWGVGRRAQARRHQRSASPGHLPPLRSAAGAAVHNVIGEQGAHGACRAP